jgi:copper(I)-binding protein
MNRLIMSLLMAAAFVAGPAAADAPAVTQAWARATPPGATVAAVYLTIDNAGGAADRLVSVSTAVADRSEVHATVREGDVVRMRRIEPLDVGAGERVAFEPGGRHVMLMGLQAPLVQGSRIAVTLEFEKAGPVRVEADVLAGDATDPHAGHHH